MTLAEELGLEPGPALQALERAILNHDPGLDPPQPARAGAGARGQARGRCLRRPHDPELASLQAALADAEAGRGRLVMLAGEAGIGKSRLADELASRAKRRGVHIAWGRCWAAGGAPAYWPWIQALRTFVRELDPDALYARLGRGAGELRHLLPELAELFPHDPAPPPLE